MKKRTKFYLCVKSVIDFIGSVLGIIFCAALFWWWAVPINAIVTKGHPFFFHDRVGKDGKIFKIYKFRTMTLNADANMSSSNESRTAYITKFGRILRLTSIDETLQLINILKGDMAFIGPRPLIDKNDDAITISERKKNGAIALKPGLSGYAQTHGRTDIGPIRKAELDKYYLDHISLWLDIKIFIKSVLNVFLYPDGE